jgi:hypothetical protein
MRDRARITVTSVVYTLLALAAIAALWPVVDTMLRVRAKGLAPETELLFNTMLPVAALVLLAVIYVEARAGT